MTDILTFIVEDGGLDDASLFDDHSVAELMTYDVFSVTPATSIRRAASVMRKRGVHRVLVMEDRVLEGIVSALDIAELVSRTGLPGKSGVTLEMPHGKPSRWITV
jgi:CBS domain-containing protein